MLKVELVYVAKDKTTFMRRLNLQNQATVADAIRESGVIEAYPEAKDLPLGIYAKPVTPETLLKEGDRVEIYRPLSLDPKEKRRQRARLKACAPCAPKNL